MTLAGKINGSKCIVVGAGIGGLSAAAALSPYFESIKIIEKDRLSDFPTNRKSTVQSNHLHSLLIAGQNVLENFYPGITEDLKNAGGVILRAGLEQQIFEFGTWMTKRDLGLNISAQSRLLLEFTVRKRTSMLSNVEIMDSTKVESLVIENNKVVGVSYKVKDNAKKIMSADVVIDASGLSGTLSTKLNKICPEIEQEKETISSNIVYVTALIKKPKEWLNRKENVLIIAEPHQTCGGGLLDIEDDSWIVSLNGRNGVVPPIEPVQWKEFAHQLASPAIWERIKDCDIQGKLHKFNKPISFLRRFDKVSNLPMDYFPLGDTVNSMNPTFGQGMALALGHAYRLRETFSNDAVLDKQKHYINKITKFSQRTWRQTVAYESMFSSSNEMIRKKNHILQALVLNKHKQAKDCSEVHLQLFKQAQMLT